MAFDDWKGSASRKWIYNHLGYWGRVGSFEFSTPFQGNIAPSVTITTGRHMPSARAEIDVTNFSREISGQISVGDEVEWQWNYHSVPQSIVTIFKGYVTQILDGQQMKIIAQDGMYNLFKERYSESFKDETPAGILSWFLAKVGLSGKFWDEGVRLPNYSVRQKHAVDVAGDMIHAVQRYSGEDTSDWTFFLDEDGDFVWGPYETHSKSTAKFAMGLREGEEVLDYRPATNRPGRILMLARPSLVHSQEIDIYPRDGGTKVHARVETVKFKQQSRKLRMEITFIPWS